MRCFTEALAALVLIASIQVARGHGGGLHNWSFLPTPTLGKEFIRYQVATCSSWSPVDPAAGTLGALPMFPPAPANMTVSGSASIFYYLDGNCTDRATTSIDINVTLTINGAPYAGKQVNGYGFIGNCSNPNDFYRHNYSLGDSRFNLVWFRKENAANTTDSGMLYGAAPNVMITRVPPVTDALRSLVLFPSPADSNPVCCNLVYAPPPPDSFFTGGSFCRVPAPPPPSPPSPSPSPPPSPMPSPKPSSPKPLSPKPLSPKLLSPRPPSPKPPSPKRK